MDQPFLLVGNAARESRVLITVVLWVLVAAPLLGLICWRVVKAFGPAAGNIVGAGLAITLIVFAIVLFSRKSRYTLTFAPDAIRLVDDRGKVIESLAADSIESEIACHVYTGRGTNRIPVVVLHDKFHELTIGANSSAEPPATTRQVSAPRFLVEEAELPRLIAVLAAARRPAK